MNKPMPDLNYLKNILDYDSSTGEFVRKICTNNKHKIGEIAGHIHIDKKFNKKYYIISINKKHYKAHRVAYYYVTGIDPNNFQIDHINGNSLDNRFENLRLANNAQNCKNQKKFKNNTSGFKGVCWHKRDKKWYARIRTNNKLIHLGRYDSKFYAALVYARAAKKYFGEWRRAQSTSFSSSTFSSKMM